MKQKYYMGLGNKDTEEGWIYKSTGIETKDSIELIEEFTGNGSIGIYEKSGVIEISKEDYYSIATELEKEDFDELFISNRIEEIINKFKGW